MARISLGIIGISCIISILFISPLTAQVVDDFSDGNFTSNPPWTGDTTNFEVNAQHQLHLKSSGTDSACMVTPSSLLDSTEWIIWVRLSFSPSANNYCRIYLVSDNAELTQPLNGYYLQLGEAGSSDAIELFRQQGTSRYSVCRGKEGFISASFAVRIKVTRNTAGNWSLLADSTGGNIFLEQATGWENTAMVPGFFGIVCRYTSSNATKFYFDEVIVRNIQVDLSPPQLQTIKVPDCNHLELKFSEPLDPAGIMDRMNYMVDQDVGYPDDIAYSLSGLTNINLYFSTGFKPRQQYTLRVSGVSDLAGNMIIDTTMSFQYYRPESYDIVINEIMADPEPQVGLPPVEYLELYNTTIYNVDLDGWKLQIGTTTRTFPASNFPAGSYLILADSNARPLFPDNVNFLGFPTFSLPNDGGTLTLLNRENQLIHTITYTGDWYDDPLKEDGGWALEQIDPFNPCGGKENWRCSLSTLGGTPGYINTVRADNPDNEAPVPSFIGVTDPGNIRVFFSESLDTSCFKGVSSFLINPGGIQPSTIKYHKPDYASVYLSFHSSMQPGTIYNLLFIDTLCDCAGNNRQISYSMPFGLPEEPEKGDVVINEILFNPETDVPEFFELFNMSTRIIGLNSLLLAETDSATLQITGKYLLTADCRLFFPGEYLAFTADPVALCKKYLTNFPMGVIQMDPFPALVNTGGCISLVNRQDQVLDPVIYNENMHYPMLSNSKGVSLERISAVSSGMKRENWHSASSSSGFATPAMKNSQAIDGFLSSADIAMEPPVFSPDNDGYQDLLTIKCKLEKPGFLANINIFNSAGQPVRILASNILLGNEDVFVWDGIDDRGYISPIGLYIVFFEFFNSTGEVSHIKKVTVLGGRL